RFVGAVAMPAAPAERAPQADAPALPATPAHAQLPARTTFFGREGEIARISSLLSQPACRLLTISGPGGIGKTSLALEALQTLQADGQPGTYVRMEHVERNHFEWAIATALGIQPGGDVRRQLIELLRHNPPLLVL